MKDFFEEIGALIVIGFVALIAVCLLLTPFMFIGSQVDSRACRLTAEKMKVAYDYSIETGCMVEYNGRFMPLSSIRIIP